MKKIAVESSNAAFGGWATRLLAPHRRTLRPQAKLTVNRPGDVYEREADRIAERVVGMRRAATSPVGHAPPGVQRKCTECEDEEQVQRKCAGCEEEEEEQVQRSVLPGVAQAPAIQRALPVDSVVPPEEENESTVQRSGDAAPGQAPSSFGPGLNQATGAGGRTLEGAVRSYMEPRFGLDFASVRLHDDARADRLARSIRARAFTHGNHVFFSRGAYQPGTNAGRLLLAHELTHTVQQTGSGGSGLHRVQRRARPHVMRAACTDWDTVAGNAINTYNCAGLALRSYNMISPASKVLTEIGKQGAASSVGCGDDCGFGKVKYWLWTYTLHLTEDAPNQSNHPYYSGSDFHVVAGTDPSSVYSKNGRRPVYGPAAGSSWRPAAQERATSNNASETPVTRNGNPVTKHRTGMSAECGCFDCS